jgi:bifunctional enzyme Fae/Hps
MILDRRKKYLQIALNGSATEAMSVLGRLPDDERIIIEAGTPLLKNSGVGIIRQIKYYGYKYVVADMKTMDRGATEVVMAARAGASAIVALGLAPVETINSFVENCKNTGVDSMIDMMNVEQPLKVMRSWKKMPDVVILHRGVDETEFNREKPIPYLQINKIRSSYDVMISIAGGDDIREIQRAMFNDADIVVVWKGFARYSTDTVDLATQFLTGIK